jgi:hypothetical protein
VLFLTRIVYQKITREGNAPMKMEATVPEFLELIKEVRKSSEKSSE